jgi:hypothetical protein
MLDAAHGLKGHRDWGWVADLLDDKVLMSKRVSIDWGLNYASSAQQAIETGVSVANAFTTEDNPAFPTIPVKRFDFDTAIDLIGVDPARIDLIA